MKKRNPTAVSLQLKQYNNKIIKSKKIYNRKNKKKDRYQQPLKIAKVVSYNDLNALVAQLVEVSDLESEGCQFESDQEHHF